MLTLIFVALRSVVIYLVIILGIRIFGKREISQLSTVDLVFILLISNSVQNAMVGPDTSLIGGIVAAGTLFLVNMILGKLLFRSKKLTNLLEGEDIMLIYKGKVIEKHLEQANLSHDELQQAAREHGVEHLSDVDLAVLENDGTISILSKNFSHQSARKRHAHKVVQK